VSKQIRASTSLHSSFLDREVAGIALLFIFLLIALLPTTYVFKHFNAETHFTSLIYFGLDAQNRELPQVRALNPVTDTELGYDGQYYAQLAFDPALRNASLLDTTLDDAAYRSQRIFLPLIAYFVGLGQPSLILDAYALLNLCFWFLLAFGLNYYLKPSTLREVICLLAILLTTGSLVSVQRSLTDLPAATFVFYSAALSGEAAAFALLLAALTKETMLLSLPAAALPPKVNAKSAAFMLLRRGALVLIPVACWFTYIRYVFHHGTRDVVLFDWPLHGWAVTLARNWSALLKTPVKLHLAVTEWDWHFFEFFSLVSAIFQIGYLIVRRRVESRYWRMAIGFAVCFLFFDASVLVEEISFCRDLLLVTIAFNIGLQREKGAPFLFCYALGNGGLLWGLKSTLSYCLFR
jgi:hypothetical protein